MPSEACAGRGWWWIHIWTSLTLAAAFATAYTPRICCGKSYVFPIDGQERRPTRSLVKGALPTRATWTDKGPTAGSGGFQKTGFKVATGSSKTEMSPPRSRKLQVKETLKSTAWSVSSKLPSSSKGPFLPRLYFHRPPSTNTDDSEASALRGIEEVRWRNGEVNHSPLQKQEPEASSRGEAGEPFELSSEF